MNKKAALELSIGTIVVIVIGMAMLALGLILVQQIFSGSTDSIDILTEGVQNQIQGLFPSTNDDIVIALSGGKTAKVKANNEPFGVAFGARTRDGSTATRERLQYRISLDKDDPRNCYNLLGESATVSMFHDRLDIYKSFEKYGGSNAFSLIKFTIPKGTAACTQTVYIDVKDVQGDAEPYAGDFFDIEVARAGIFG